MRSNCDDPAQLSPQRKKVLQFLAESKSFPDSAAVAKHMGWKTKTGVSDVLHVLRVLGFVKRDRNPNSSRHYWIWSLMTRGGRQGQHRSFPSRSKRTAAPCENRSAWEATSK